MALLLMSSVMHFVLPDLSSNRIAQTNGDDQDVKITRIMMVLNLHIAYGNMILGLVNQIIEIKV